MTKAKNSRSDVEQIIKFADVCKMYQDKIDKLEFENSILKKLLQVRGKK